MKMTCRACGGDARGCEACRGKAVEVAEVPPDLGTRPGMAEFARAYRWLSTHGQLPGPGGWRDQAATFIDAVDTFEAWVDREQRRIDAEREKARAAATKQRKG